MNSVMSGKNATMLNSHARLLNAEALAVLVLNISGTFTTTASTSTPNSAAASQRKAPLHNALLAYETNAHLPHRVVNGPNPLDMLLSP